MKKLFTPAILLVIVAACNQPAPPTAPVVDTVGESNKAIVKQYTDAVVKGDTVAMASFLADNFRAYGPGSNDSTNLENHLKSWKKSWREEFASIDFQSAGLIAFNVPADGKYPGDWVADWAVITVNYKNGNKPVTFWFHDVNRVKDGKIELSRSFYNVNDFYTQHGFKVTPPEAPAK